MPKKLEAFTPEEKAELDQLIEARDKVSKKLAAITVGMKNAHKKMETAKPEARAVLTQAYRGYLKRLLKESENIAKIDASVSKLFN